MKREATYLLQRDMFIYPNRTIYKNRKFAWGLFLFKRPSFYKLVSAIEENKSNDFIYVRTYVFVCVYVWCGVDFRNVRYILTSKCNPFHHV